MMLASSPQELVASLWPTGDSPEGPAVCAIVDAARDPRVIDMLRTTDLEQACLFSGTLPPTLRAASPHLVRLAPDDRFTRELFAQGWGRSWFTICVTWPGVPLARLRHHLRSTWLRVQAAGGASLFRFYDPRVLGVFLPSCTRREVLQTFGVVDAWIHESGHPPVMVRFDRSSAPIGGDDAVATGAAARVRLRPEQLQRLQAAATQDFDRQTAEWLRGHPPAASLAPDRVLSIAAAARNFARATRCTRLSDVRQLALDICSQGEGAVRARLAASSRPAEA